MSCDSTDSTILLHIRTSSCFFFFFQAEDGIRDLTVTGVQTCALPICRRWGACSPPARVPPRCRRDPDAAAPPRRPARRASSAARRARARRAGGRAAPRANAATRSWRAALPPGGELRQEAHVAVEQQPDVGNAVAGHRDPVRAHAPGEAGVPLAVHPAVLEDGRVHHTGAEDLHPAGLLARRAARAPADLALHVHLGRGLREGEERRPEPHPRVRAEEAAGGRRERGLEIYEAYPPRHREGLSLL